MIIMDDHGPILDPIPLSSSISAKPTWLNTVDGFNQLSLVSDPTIYKGFFNLSQMVIARISETSAFQLENYYGGMVGEIFPESGYLPPHNHGTI